MVRRDEVDCAIAEAGPKLFAIFARADGRRAFEFGRGVGDFLGREGQIVRAGLDAEREARGLCFPPLRDGIG